LVTTTLYVALAEWGNEGTLGTVAPASRPMLALFQSAMWTSGFSAIDAGAFHEETKFFQAVLMMIGGAAGSPAGGIKVATAVILAYAAFATVRGDDDIVIFGGRLPTAVVRQAGVIALAFLFTFLTMGILLLAAGDLPLIDVLYETASALGTVGWSTGITSEFGTTGRIVLIVTMLTGRFLPLLLVLQMVRPRRRSPRLLPTDSIRLG